MRARFEHETISEQEEEDQEVDERIELFKKLENSKAVNRQTTTIGAEILTDDPAGRNSKNLTQYTIKMLNFIPATILLQLSSGSGVKYSHKDLPLEFSSRSVTIVFEIRYFYENQFSQTHNRFPDEQSLNEHLSTLSAQFLECLTSNLTKYGGDLIQFFGRAAIAIFPNGDDRDLCRRASGCALQISKECNKFLQQNGQKSDNSPDTCLYIGIGFGDIQLLHVGGILNRIEFFVAGQALIRAIRALRYADHKTESVCVSGEMWIYIKDDFFGSQIEQTKQNLTIFSPQRPKVFLEDPKPEELFFFFITQSKVNIRPARDMILQRVKTSEDIIIAIQLQLKYYIPGSYRTLSQIKSEEICSGQHYKQTVVAVAIELNHNDRRKKHNSLKLLQSFIQVIQAQVYKMEGSVTKIQTYETGIIFIATWGMQFMTHQDDCARAVFAAINIKKQLTKLQLDMELEDDSLVEPPVHIGIASGDVYQGVVGNFARREIVGIGETCERAIYLLQSAYHHYSKIYVDVTTKQLASSALNFEYVEHIEIPHQTINLAIFMPVLIDEREKYSVHKDKQNARKQAQEIRIHVNPFFIDRDNFYLQNYSEAYGRQVTVNHVIADIAEYINSEDESTTVWVLAIKGPYGSGKSLFARKMILELADNEKTILKPINIRLPQLRFEYLVCNNDANKNTQIVGVWRTFLQHLLELYSQSQGQSKENIINAQLQHQQAIDDKVTTIQEIFGLQHIAKKGLNIKAKLDQTKISAEHYDEDYEDLILFFCFEFICHALDALRDQLIFLLVIDNASGMNYSSWRLFDLMQSQCQFLVLVLCFESETNYFQKLPQEKVSHLGFKITGEQVSQRYFKDFIKPREFEIFSVAEMTPISQDSLAKALQELSPVYERTMNREIEDLTKVINAKGSNKTYAEQKEVKMRLISSYQVYQHFDTIEDQILEKVIEQSGGNPMIAFQLVYQLIMQGHVAVENHCLSSGAKFRNCVQFNAWTSLPLPFQLMKIMNFQLEQALKASNTRMSKLSSAMTVQLLQILVTAAVIGEIFSQKMLDASCKIVVEKHKYVTTAEILREAEERDLVELIVVDENSGDSIFRFTNPWMRAALIQMQSFTLQKKETIQSIIKYMEERIVLDYTNGFQLDQEYFFFQKQLMRVERVQTDDMLSQSARQKLQVKKINHQLHREATNIKKGNLKLIIESQKQQENVLVVLTQKRVEFYLVIQATKPIYKFHSYADLKNVKVKKVNDEPDMEQFSFRLAVNKWHRSEKLDGTFSEQKQDILILSQSSESKKARREAQDWMTALEYMRTKLLYELFAEQYGQIKFPLSGTLGEHQEVTVMKTQQRRSFRLSKGLNKVPMKRSEMSQSLSQEIPQKNMKFGEKHSPETILLARKIKALFNIAAFQFYKHVGNQQSNTTLGQVEPQLQPFFSQLCVNMIDHQSELASQEQSQLDDSQNQQSLMSAENSQVTSPAQVQSENSQDPVQKDTEWEQHKIVNLNQLNALWEEGEVITSEIQCQKAEKQEFKLLRKWDCMGYNQAPGPFRQMIQQTESLKASIIDFQSDLKSPEKNRRPKAEAIQKILENSNSQWYSNYKSAIKNRPKPQTPSQLSEEKSQNSSQQSQEGHTIREGGLTESHSHVSIGRSQALDTPIKARRMTLRSSMNSKYQVPHNITAESHSEASFKDYQEQNRTPTPAKELDDYGVPMTIIAVNPQVIAPSGQRVILKKGDVVYLSEKIKDTLIVKCHTYVNGEKLDLIVSRNELIVANDSQPLIASSMKRQYTQQAMVHIKNIKSKETIFEHRENSSINLQKPYTDVQAYLSRQSSPDAYMRRQDSKKQLPDNNLFRKLRERQQARLKRDEILKQRPLSELLNSTPARCSPPMKTIAEQSPSDEISPLTNQSPMMGAGIISQLSAKKPLLKVAERLRKRQQQQL